MGTNGPEFYKGTRMDAATGRELCCNCFDGRHFYKWSSRRFEKDGTPKKKIVESHKGSFLNCLQGDCECFCVKLAIEKSSVPNAKEREKLQAELQQTISTEDVLEFTKGRSEPEMVKAKP